MPRRLSTNYNDITTSLLYFSPAPQSARFLPFIFCLRERICLAEGEPKEKQHQQNFKHAHISFRPWNKLSNGREPKDIVAVNSTNARITLQKWKEHRRGDRRTTRSTAHGCYVLTTAPRAQEFQFVSEKYINFLNAVERAQEAALPALLAPGKQPGLPRR